MYVWVMHVGMWNSEILWCRVWIFSECSPEPGPGYFSQPEEDRTAEGTRSLCMNGQILQFGWLFHFSLCLFMHITLISASQCLHDVSMRFNLSNYTYISTHDTCMCSCIYASPIIMSIVTNCPLFHCLGKVGIFSQRYFLPVSGGR